MRLRLWDSHGIRQYLVLFPAFPSVLGHCQTVVLRVRRDFHIIPYHHQCSLHGETQIK